MAVATRGLSSIIQNHVYNVMRGTDISMKCGCHTNYNLPFGLKKKKVEGRLGGSVN